MVEKKIYIIFSPRSPISLKVGGALGRRNVLHLQDTYRAEHAVSV